MARKQKAAATSSPAPIAMAVETWPIERLKPYPDNPRRNQETVESVARSIAEFGFNQPVVVDPEGVIVVGHTRWEAAGKLGLRHVPVFVMRGKSAMQIRAYRLADNRTHENSLWDEEALQREILAQIQGGFDATLTGFAEDEIQRLVGEISPASIAEAPATVQDNVQRLADVKAQRARGNASVIEKSDTERYLVVVFPDRLSREAAVKRLGLPIDERYVDAGAIELKQRIGGQREIKVRAERATAAAPSNKAGATG